MALVCLTFIDLPTLCVAMLPTHKVATFKMKRIASYLNTFRLNQSKCGHVMLKAHKFNYLFEKKIN